MFKLSSIIKAAIGAISNGLDLIAPDEMTLEQKESWQKIVGSTYAVAKNFGPKLVLSTENDLDDAVLNEMIEICENAAAKYDLKLDPTLI